MKVIDVIRELIAKEISKTSLGNDIHYIIESQDKLNSWADTALEHLIKLEVIKDTRYRNTWLETIRKSFINIAKNSWVKSQNKNKVRSLLMQVLGNFNEHYLYSRSDFNSNLKKNQSEFPKNYTKEQRLSVIAKWKLCVDKYMSGDLEFFMDLDSYL